MSIPVWFINGSEHEFPVAIIVVRSRVFLLRRLLVSLVRVTKRGHTPLCASLPDPPRRNTVSHMRLRKTRRMALCWRTSSEPT